MTDKAIDTVDCLDWQKLRNMKLIEWVGDRNAIDFVLTVSAAAEFFDDLIDRDKPYTDNQAISLLFKIMIDMPANPFFEQYKYNLLPVMNAALNAWVDSISLERNEGDTGMNLAYVLRFWCIEILMSVIGITRGREYLRQVSLEVRKFFMCYESLDEYKEKLQ